MTGDDAILAEAATKLTAPAENTILHPYQDPGGIWTIGTGSTRDINGNPITANTPPITQAQALQLLERDLRSALQTVENDVPVALTEGQGAALTDFVYNIGSGNFAHSTVLACLKAADYHGACRHLADWNQQHGVVLGGLVKRRAAEQAEFESGDHTASAS
jgi:lysozyme